MKKYKTCIIVLGVLLAASVVLNVISLTKSTKSANNPEWLADEVSEQEAALDGYDPTFMQMALQIAEENVTSGSGGPIGAVIVKDGEVIAATSNEMRQNCNSYDHGEMAAIR